MTEAVLVKLIEKRLQAWADEQDVAIAFGNSGLKYAGEPFTPATDSIYATVRHLPATTTGAFLGGGHKALVGLFQVSIVCPKGKGEGPGRAKGMTLDTKFPMNLRLAEGAFSVQITSPVTLGPTINDSEGSKTARCAQPCSFSYRADLVS